MRAVIMALAFLTALASTAPTLAQVSEPRRVGGPPTATCNAWINWANATVVCKDVPFATSTTRGTSTPWPTTPASAWSIPRNRLLPGAAGVRSLGKARERP